MLRLVASWVLWSVVGGGCGSAEPPESASTIQVEPTPPMTPFMPAALGGSGTAGEHATVITTAGNAAPKPMQAAVAPAAVGGNFAASADAPSARGGSAGTPEVMAGSMASAVAGSGGSASAVDPRSCRTTQAAKDVPTIHVIGDSTASVYASSLYPRMGWAQPLPEYFVSACAAVHDAALSGRSSKSFYDEGAWTPVKDALRAGDFVLIQFGHNDEKSEDGARYTDPNTTYPQYLSKYIDDTIAKGATPILLTSIERNKWSGGELKESHGQYPRAVRELAAQRMLILVDMTSLTHEYFERLGEDMTSKLFMNLAPGEYPNYPNGNADDTHLQEKGAHIVAEIALAELARQGTPIAAWLKSVPSPP